MQPLLKMIPLRLLVWPFLSLTNGFWIVLTQNSILKKNYWIVDSGATYHISTNSIFFSQYASLTNTFVTLHNKTQVKFHAIDCVTLGSTIQLLNVLYILDFMVNIVLVNALTKDSNYCLLFMLIILWFRNHTNKRWLVGVVCSKAYTSMTINSYHLLLLILIIRVQVWLVIMSLILCLVMFLIVMLWVMFNINFGILG